MTNEIELEGLVVFLFVVYSAIIELHDHWDLIITIFGFGDERLQMLEYGM